MKSNKKRFVPALLLITLIMIIALPEYALAFSNFPPGSSVPNVSVPHRTLRQLRKQ